LILTTGLEVNVFEHIESMLLCSLLNITCSLGVKFPISYSSSTPLFKKSSRSS